MSGTATAQKTEQKTKSMDRKSNLNLFGITERPHKATQVLAKPMEGNHEGAVSLIVIHGGNYTAMNAYLKDGGLRLGSGYDPSNYTYPITEKARKKWVKKGYEPAEVKDFPFLTQA